MKRRFLFFLMAIFLLAGFSKMAAQESKVDLRGIWQMCFYMSSDPELPGELKPSNSFKILSRTPIEINTFQPWKCAMMWFLSI